jgi:hypothetical protein
MELQVGCVLCAVGVLLYAFINVTLPSNQFIIHINNNTCRQAGELEFLAPRLLAAADSLRLQLSVHLYVTGGEAAIIMIIIMIVMMYACMLFLYDCMSACTVSCHTCHLFVLFVAR